MPLGVLIMTNGRPLLRAIYEVILHAYNIRLQKRFNNPFRGIEPGRLDRGSSTITARPGLQPMEKLLTLSENLNRKIYFQVHHLVAKEQSFYKNIIRLMFCKSGVDVTDVRKHIFCKKLMCFIRGCQILFIGRDVLAFSKSRFANVYHMDICLQDDSFLI